MAFNLFKKNHEDTVVEEIPTLQEKKGYLSIPESMYDAPFENIIACLDPKYVVDAIVCDFDKIFPYRKVEDYRFLKNYPEWKLLMVENWDDILYSLTSLADFKKLISYYPEYSFEIYQYLLEQYLSGINTDDMWLNHEIDMIEDILLPMADLENIQKCYFSIVRKRAVEILDITESYEEMWHVMNIFENSFGMCREDFKEYFDTEFEFFIDSFDDYEGSIFNDEDYEALNDFFIDSEAYNAFMDRLPSLLKHSGITLYAVLIKLLGPVKEILDLHNDCAEIVHAEQEEVKIFLEAE